MAKRIKIASTKNLAKNKGHNWLFLPWGPVALIVAIMALAVFVILMKADNQQPSTSEPTNQPSIVEGASTTYNWHLGGGAVELRSPREPFETLGYLVGFEESALYVDGKICAPDYVLPVIRSKEGVIHTPCYNQFINGVNWSLQIGTLFSVGGASGSLSVTYWEIEHISQ